MDKLDFILGGVQKGGTTTLFTHLKRHPEIGMTLQKETHFFDNEKRDWDHPDYADLNALMPARGPGMVLGEATPATIYWTPAHERLAAYNPDLKIMLIFRDPVARAFSQWRMDRERHETLGFSEAIREGRERLFSLRQSRQGMSRRFSYVERGFYAEQLKSLLGYFPKEQILWFASEDLAADPQGLLGRISDFLGVSDRWRFRETRLRQATSDASAPTLSAEDAAYLRDLYREDLTEFVAMTGLGTSWLDGGRA